MQGKGLFWWIDLLFFFFSKHTAHGGERHLRGQSALCWLEQGSGQGGLASSSQPPVIWGDGMSKKLVLGRERVLGKVPGADARRSRQRRQQH